MNSSQMMVEAGWHFDTRIELIDKFGFWSVYRWSFLDDKEELASLRTYIGFDEIVWC